MQCMGSAESTIFLSLHPVRMRLLIFGGIVVTLLTFCARQCNSCTHDSSSILLPDFEHKKKT